MLGFLQMTGSDIIAAIRKLSYEMKLSSIFISHTNLKFYIKVISFWHNIKNRRIQIDVLKVNTLVKLTMRIAPRV